MDEIKEYIKICIKQNNFTSLNPEKIKIISSYGFYKVYHNSDFICYINNDVINYKENVGIWGIHFLNSINSYNELLKTKKTTCILCITNEDQLIIEYVLNQLIKFRHMKILLVGKNDKYIGIAINLNIDYIIAQKNEYKAMIHTGLTYLRSSNITNNTIMVSNTETLINNDSLSQILGKFNQLFHFCGPTNIKYLDITSNLIIPHQVTSVNNSFLINWFLISKTVLTPVNWNLFDGPIDIYEILNLYITNSKSRILKITDANSICFNCDKNKNIIQSSANYNFNISEHKLLSLFVKDLPKQKYKSIHDCMEKIISDCKISPIAIERTQDNRKKIITPIANLKFQTKPILREIDNLSETIIQKETSLKFNIGKYYFINNYLSKQELIMKIKNMPYLEHLNYMIIDGNKNKINGHIASINDAITKNLNKIIIIEDKLLSDGIFQSLNKPDTFPLSWDFLILAPIKSTSRISKLTMDNKRIFEISIFAYCIDKLVYKK